MNAQDLANRFNQQVLQNGLREIIEEHPNCGMSGMFGDVKIFSFYALDTILIAVRHGDCILDMKGRDIGRATNRLLRCKPFTGNIAQAQQMINAVIATWQGLAQTQRAAAYSLDNRVTNPAFTDLNTHREE